MNNLSVDHLIGIKDLTNKSIPALLEKTDSDIVRRVLELRQAL
jgi:hypothetical protein